MPVSEKLGENDIAALDLADHAMRKVRNAVFDTMSLIDEPVRAAMVALAAANVCVAMAAASFAKSVRAAGEEMPQQEATNHALHILSNLITRPNEFIDELYAPRRPSKTRG